MKKFLIIDDSLEWIKFHTQNLKTFFDKNEISIKTAMNARDGFTELQKNSDYDVIISDLEMELSFDERYAGEWLVKQAQQIINPAKTKIVIISGAYNIKHIAQELNVAFLPKPSLINNPLSFKYLIEELIKK